MYGCRVSTHFRGLENLYEQSGSFQIRPSHGVMIVSAGYKVTHRIEMAYGVVDLDGHLVPLDLDLSKYNRLLVDFEVLNQLVNFNIVLTNTSGVRAQLGQNIIPSSRTFPATFPFTDFIPSGDFDWSHISVITLVSQAVNGCDYALTKIWATAS
jgi:hypothetical protein